MTGNLSFFQGGRTTRLDRKESYKAQRRSYAKEKKRVERELLSTFKDQSIIVLADWLKVRGTLKGWTKLWCILKPGLLLLYRSPKAKVTFIDLLLSTTLHTATQWAKYHSKNLSSNPHFLNYLYKKGGRK